MRSIIFSSTTNIFCWNHESYTIALELATMVFHLNKLRNYLYDVKFDLFSDYESLKYLFDHKELNIRQRQWMKFLKDYDF